MPYHSNALRLGQGTWYNEVPCAWQVGHGASTSCRVFRLNAGFDRGRRRVVAGRGLLTAANDHEAKSDFRRSLWSTLRRGFYDGEDLAGEFLAAKLLDHPPPAEDFPRLTSCYVL